MGDVAPNKKELASKAAVDMTTFDERENSVMRMIGFKDPDGLVTDKEEAAKELWDAGIKAWAKTGLAPDENFEPVVFKTEDSMWAMMMKVKPSHTKNTKVDPMEHMRKNSTRLEDKIAEKLGAPS